MKIKKYQKEIREVLEKYPETRDNTVLLYYRVLEKLGYVIHQLSFAQVMRLMYDKEIPHWESVSRCSRDLQEANEELAGKKRKARMKHQEDVKEELGYPKRLNN